jgi:hypothetical protein
MGSPGGSVPGGADVAFDFKHGWQTEKYFGLIGCVDTADLMFLIV